MLIKYVIGAIRYLLGAILDDYIVLLPEKFWGKIKICYSLGEGLLNLIEDVCFELLLKMYKYFQSLDTTNCEIFSSPFIWPIYGLNKYSNIYIFFDQMEIIAKKK